MKKTTRLLFLLSLLAFLPTCLSAQWTKTKGLAGGNTGGFLNYGDTIIANMGDELYFSSNHGQSWVLMPNANGINLLTAYTDGQRILGSTYDSKIGLRLSISDDFGQSWLPIASPDTMYFYAAFLAYGYIYGSDNNGLYRTNDNGAHWEYVRHQYIGEPQFDGQHITGRFSGKVIQSTDGGFTWNNIFQYSGNSGEFFQHENYLFMFMQNAPYDCYSSSDYGQTWSHYPGTGFDQVYYYLWHNGSVYGLDSKKLRKSSDLGQTWVNVPLPDNAPLQAFRGVSAGNTMIIGGIFNSVSGSLLGSTDEGASWFHADQGIYAASGKLRSIENKLYAAGQSGLFQLNADGLNWTKQNPNFTPSPYSQYTFTDIIKSGDNLLFSDGDDAFVSIDGGQSWNESFVPNISGLEQISAFETVGTNLCAWGSTYGGGILYLSENNGLSFQQLPFLIWKQAVDQDKLYLFASDKKIYRFDDAGATLILQASNIPTNTLFQQGSSGLAFTVAGDAMLLNAGTNSLFSNDGGQSWSYYDGTTAGIPWSAPYPSEMLQIGNYLLLGTGNGVFISSNNGVNWEAWNQGIVHHFIITNLELHDGYLWAGTRDGGIWKRPIGELDMNQVATKDLFDENASFAPLRLIPNPATEMVLVETGGQAGELIVQDGTGRVVLRKFIDGSNASFSVVGLPNGLYQVVYWGEKTMQHKPLAVLH